MRESSWAVLAAIVLAITGCNEFMTSEKPTPVSAVDVVGDPADPVADSAEESDILAAESDLHGATIADADATSPSTAEPTEARQQPVPGPPPELDHAQSVQKSRPTRLKTTRREASVTK